MLAENFTVNSPGQLVKTAQGYLAFVPAPLPPVLVLSWELVSRLSAAERAISQLAGVGRIIRASGDDGCRRRRSLESNSASSAAKYRKADCRWHPERSQRATAVSNLYCYGNCQSLGSCRALTPIGEVV